MLRIFMIQLAVLSFCCCKEPSPPMPDSPYISGAPVYLPPDSIQMACDSSCWRDGFETVSCSNLAGARVDDNNLVLLNMDFSKLLPNTLHSLYADNPHPLKDKSIQNKGISYYMYLWQWRKLKDGEVNPDNLCSDLVMVGDNVVEPEVYKITASDIQVIRWANGDAEVMLHGFFPDKVGVKGRNKEFRLCFKAYEVCYPQRSLDPDLEAN